MPTQYQRRRFARYFIQNATAIQAILAKDEKFLTENYGKDTTRVTKVKFEDRISVKSFAALLSRIGPPITEEQAQQFIYEYDSTLAGSLNYTDFQEFMADYYVILQHGKSVALDYWQEQSQLAGYSQAAEEFLISHEYSLDNYLRSIGFEDPENLLVDQDELTLSIRENPIIDNPMILTRHLSVRIFACYNLEETLRVKKRKDCVDFKSLNPFIRMKCVGINLETTVIIGGAAPNWEQSLDVTIHIPKGNINDIQQWVQLENIEFYLYDSVEEGNLPSSELIAYASVPLIRVLLSTYQPLNAVLTMIRPDCSDDDQFKPLLEVSFFDQSAEQWSWAKVADSYLSCEEVWLMGYADKIKHDLGTKCIKKPPQDPKKMKIFQNRVFSLFLSTVEGLQSIFPLRQYRMIYLDEYNDFRFLNSIVRPINVQDPQLLSLVSLAKAVANIPYEKNILNPLWHIQLSKVTSQVNANDRLNAWLGQGKPGSYATETFMGQTNSPSTILSRRRGTLFEHAILLCSLFRGKGIQSYIAIGSINHRTYAWVITIIPRKQIDSSPLYSGLEPPDFPTIPTRTEYEESVFYQSYFKKRDQVRSEMLFLKENAVHHWDPLSGHYFDTTDKSTPFDELNTMFDEKNIYFNVQTNVCRNLVFSWDISNQKKWVPFFNDSVILKAGQVSCQCKYY